MLSYLFEKHAAETVKVLALILAAVLSFFAAASLIPETEFVKRSIESVEESKDTVMRFSAATLTASLAISALPDDFATPVAESFADMNTYFIAILAVLFLEGVMVEYGIKLAFLYLIPAACIFGILYTLKRNTLLKGLAVRACFLGLAVALLVPCSTHLTNYVASDLMEYVNETIEETEAGSSKLSEAAEDGSGDKSIFEKLSELFQTAIDGVTGLMQHFKNTVRKCMNSIAILILANCLMPLLTFFVFRWILKELFQIVLPAPAPRRRRESRVSESDSARGYAAVGGREKDED